jgi:hypothetical protein
MTATAPLDRVIVIAPLMRFRQIKKGRTVPAGSVIAGTA